MGSFKNISGRELAELMNEVNRQIEEDKVQGKNIDRLVDLLGKLVEEYHDRFINGGDLEGYKETLIIDDRED